MRSKLLLLMMAVMAGCAQIRPMTPVDWTTVAPGTFLQATGLPLADVQFANLAGQHDFIIVGESHTNPCDHAVQAHILETLATLGTGLVLGLEMLPVTAQPVLDRFNARQITADDLGNEIGWEDLWGYPYSLYQPIFMVAESHNIPVLALNIPRDTLLALRDQESAPAQQNLHSLAPKLVIEPSAEQKKALAQQAEIHKMMRDQARQNSHSSPSSANQAPVPLADSKTIDRFFRVQSLWDSMMAEQALLHHEHWQLPVVIFAGGGHIEYGWGIEYRLRTLKPEARCLGVMPVRDKENLILLADSSKRALPGDMVFYYCASEYKSRLGMNLVFGSEQIRVQSVETGSLVDQAGLKSGDILTHAGGQPLKTATDLHFAAMAASRHNKGLTLTIERGTHTLTLTLPIR